MEILLIGDIHGDFVNYYKIINNFKNFKSIQLGDMGIGFGIEQDHAKKFPIPLKHKFIRGNHDNPSVCRKHKNYLGDYGITKDGIFYVSGAFSIDKEQRTIGIDWWDDEELSIRQMEDVISLYEKEKPEFVISHSQPNEFVDEVCSPNFKSKTQDCFSEMFKIHQPEKWISGHLHKNVKMFIQNTEFICVDSLYYYMLKL
jgi:predicted phosphohydrolase